MVLINHLRTYARLYFYHEEHEGLKDLNHKPFLIFVNFVCFVVKHFLCA